MNKKNNKCSSKKKIEMEKVVEQILPSMGKGKRNFKKKSPSFLFLSDHAHTFERIHQGILGTSTDYDIPFEQLNIKQENGRESER